jgi:NADH-quinone oxidoreductase subunit N
MAKDLTVRLRTTHCDPDFYYFYGSLLNYEDYNYNMSITLFNQLFIVDTFTMFMKAFFLFCFGFFLYGYARLGSPGSNFKPLTLPKAHAFIHNEGFYFDNFRKFVKERANGDRVLSDITYFHRDFYIMLPITIFFLFNLISSYNLISLFVSLEGATLCLYILAGLRVNNRLSIEAGLKYFLTSAVFSCIFGFAVFVLYLIVGSTDFYVIRETIYTIITNPESSFYLLDYALIISVLAIVIVFLMKLGAVPYHFWIGDVYQGSPLVVTTFFATMVRISFFAIFFRLIMQVFFFMQFSQVFITVLYLSAFFSIVIGSLLALVQTEIKRFLAYSSIVHTGFILIGLAAMSLEGFKSSILYTVVYIFTLLCFLVILMMSPAQIVQNRSNSFVLNFRAIKYFADLKRLSIGRQLIFIFFLFSMAGLPPFPGFVIKLYIFKSFLLDLFYNVIQWDLMLNIETAYQFLGFFSFIIVVILSLLTGYNYIRLITSASFSADENKVIISDKPIITLLNTKQRLVDSIVLFLIIILNLVLILFIPKFFNSDIFDSIVSSAYHPFFDKGFVSLYGWEEFNFVDHAGRTSYQYFPMNHILKLEVLAGNSTRVENIYAEANSYMNFFC